MIDLCTLAEVKAWANIQNNTQDSVIQSLIGSVSAYVRQYCSRDFDKDDFTETYNGAGGSKLMLRNFPVTDVSALSILGRSVPLSTSPVGFGYMFDSRCVYLVGGSNSPSPIGAAASFPAYFPRGPQNITVEYTAGYARDADPAKDTLPLDLRQAAIDLCLLKYRRRNHPERAGEVLAGQNLTYITSELTEEIKGTLDRYKRVFPV